MIEDWRVGRHGRLDIDYEWQDLVFHLDQLERLSGDRMFDGGDRCNGVALI
jgi:hypothetical protein